MPELPEVEIVKRGLSPAILRKKIAKVDLWRADIRTPIPANFKSVLTGRKISEVIRRGKYILAFLEDGEGFGLHLGMSGRIQVFAPGEKYTRAKHDHFGLTMADGTKIVFNDARRFGMLFLVKKSDWEKQKPFSEMGPEPLGRAFETHMLAKNLEGRRTPIKTALLDQRIIAGVGNIYACEALYKAGINPLKISATLKKDEVAKLSASVKAVLQKAIKAGGSSLRDYRNTDGDLGYFQHHFEVYDREGQPCPACDCNALKTGGVKRIVQAGRSTFYCPGKQK